MSLVSILIPVYNRLNLVEETICSAINQTYKNIEIVIVDNFSTDGTWELLQEIAKKDRRIRIFQNSKNIGPVKNWKRCIDEAKGVYSKILFSDDLISDNFIEETVLHLKDNVAFVLSGIKVFGEDKNYTFDNFNGLSEISTQNYFENILLLDKYHFSVSPGCALFRTNDLINSLEIDISNPLGLDFNKYGAGNDVLLFLNTAKNYPLIKIVNKTSSFFRSHPESFSVRNRLNIYYEYAKFYFISNHLPQLLSKFKSVLWLRKKRKLTNDVIYNLIERKISYYYLVTRTINLYKRIKI